MVTESSLLTRDQEIRVLTAREMLSSFKTTFDANLKVYLTDKMSLLISKYGEHTRDFYERAAEFVLDGGKRLRPAFIHYGYLAAGGRNENVAFHAGVAAELMHAALLIHDDLMDQSDLRRQKPTIHKVFGAGSKVYGDASAINMGDVLFSLAHLAFSENEGHVDAKLLIPAYRLFLEENLEVVSGQQLEATAASQQLISEEIIEAILLQKSGRYTVEKPLRIGAALAGASAEIDTAFSKYGDHLGVAFQLVDDVLGMFGDEKEVGKPVDSDLKEGKITLLVLKAGERLRQDGRTEDENRFMNIVGNAKLTADDYVWVKNIMKETGALDGVLKYAQTRVKTAQKSIRHLAIDLEAKWYLFAIADYILKRKL